jgi:hypothetical protein
LDGLNDLGKMEEVQFGVNEFYGVSPFYVCLKSRKSKSSITTCLGFECMLFVAILFDFCVVDLWFNYWNDIVNGKLDFTVETLELGLDLRNLLWHKVIIEFR